MNFKDKLTLSSTTNMPSKKIKIKLKKIKLFLSTIKKFGFTCTLKLCLRRLGLSRITPYHSFKFPFIDHKFKVVFRNNYWIEFEKGLQEINCVRFLQENVREEQIILDVGAWEGPFTLLCSNLVGPNGKVYAFDPDRIAFSNLQKNIRKNKIKNVYLENIGLSNSIGSATLHLIKGWGQTQSPLIFYKGGYNEKYTKYIQIISVPITTIDDYCEKNEDIHNSLLYQVENNATPKYIFGEYLKPNNVMLNLINSHHRTINLKLLKKIFNQIYFLRTNTSKYIKYDAINVEEFYNLEKDPNEIIEDFNKQDKEYQNLKAKMEDYFKIIQNIDEIKELVTKKERESVKKVISRIKIQGI